MTNSFKEYQPKLKKSTLGMINQLNYLEVLASGLVGLILTVIWQKASPKKRNYNISKSIDSTNNYDSKDDGDIKISLTYKGVPCDCISTIRIELTNDGMNDIIFEQRCSRPIIITAPIDIIDFRADASEEIDPKIIFNGDKYELSWSMLKVNESISLFFAAKQRSLTLSDFKFDIRADGIESIKTPEYKIWPNYYPVLIGSAIMILLFFLLANPDIAFLPFISERAFCIVTVILVDLLFLIAMLYNKIMWLKEK